MVDVNDMVQEAYRQLYGLCQPVTINIRSIFKDRFDYVNTAQIAGLARQKGLFSTWIAGFDLAEVRGWDCHG